MPVSISYHARLLISAAESCRAPGSDAWAVREWRKDSHTEKLGPGRPGSLVGQLQHSGSSAALLGKFGERGEAIGFSWMGWQGYSILINKEASLMIYVRIKETGLADPARRSYKGGKISGHKHLGADKPP